MTEAAGPAPATDRSVIRLGQHPGRRLGRHHRRPERRFHRVRQAALDARRIPKTGSALSLKESFPIMFGDAWEQARDIFYETFRGDHLAHVTPMPGAAEALVAGAAWPRGVVSNKAGAYLRAEVLHLGWGPHFGPGHRRRRR